MKKISITILLFLFTFLCNAQLKISTSGYVGIGTASPGYRLDLNIGNSDIFRIKTWTSTFVNNSGSYGSLCIFPDQDYYLQIGKNGKRAGEIWGCEIHGIWLLEYSDSTIKENIQPLHDCLNRLKQVECVQYTLKQDFIRDVPLDKQSAYTKPEYGFMAQNLQDVFPEAVVSDTSGYLSVKYTRMVPVLVEAIKEQQNIIDSLHNRLDELEKSLKAMPEAGNGAKGGQGYEVPRHETGIAVYQNNPNPTDGTTTISGYIPSEINSAALYVYDIQGNTRYKTTVMDRGYFSVTLKSGELKPGIYFYTIHGDNQVSETKQMVITK